VFVKAARILLIILRTYEATRRVVWAKRKRAVCPLLYASKGRSEAEKFINDFLEENIRTTKVFPRLKREVSN
jgi:hypothetical protein